MAGRGCADIAGILGVVLVAPWITEGIAQLELTPRTIAGFRAAGVRAILIRTCVPQSTIKRVDRLARAAGLIALMPTAVPRRDPVRHASAAAALRSCRAPAEPCAVLAPSVAIAKRVAQAFGVNVVFVRIAKPAQAQRLLVKTSRARIVALAPLSSRAGVSWKAAIELAWRAAHLDLGAAPVGRQGRSAIQLLPRPRSDCLDPTRARPAPQRPFACPKPWLQVSP